MNETIEIRFQHLGQFQGIPLYHQYIIYRDKTGTEWIGRGGPETDSRLNPGKLITTWRKFTKDDTEWLNRNTDARQILKTGDDLSAEWNAITDSLQSINMLYDYSILGNNSNTTIRTVLRDAGLPQPTETTPDGFPKYWSPGYEFITPPDNRPINPFGKTHPGNWSPIVLDIDGCGIGMTRYAASKANFDFDGDGTTERVGWFDPGEGILVLDLNGNGRIDNGSEMVGADQVNPFTALAQMDSNRDGWIDKKDSAYTTLRVWTDRNGDGSSDASELLTLSQGKVAFIPTRGYFWNSSPEGNRASYDNIFSPYGFRKNSGYTIRSIAVEVAMKNWIAPVGFKMSPAAQKIPNIKGYGRLRDLNAEATLNATVLALAQKLFTDATGIVSIQSLQETFENLLFAWANCSDIPINSRGKWIDARKVAFLAAFYDDKFYDRVAIKGRAIAKDITDDFTKFRDSLFTRFLSGIAPLVWSLTGDEQILSQNRFLQLMQLGLGSDNQFAGDFETTLSAYFKVLPKDSQNAGLFAPLINAVLAGVKRDFQISNEEYEANIIARVLSRQEDLNEVAREASYFFAFNPITTTNGERFNDSYKGQTIIWGGGSLFVGDTFSSIRSERDVDVLVLPGVSLDRVSFALTGNNVLLQIASSEPSLSDGGTITLENQTKAGVGFIALADGNVLTWEDIKRKVLTYEGTSVDETIVGVSLGRGSDYNGDTIIGGGGNDTMTGGPGDDVFVFQLGHGHDLVTDFKSSSADILAFSTRLFSDWSGLTAAMKQVRRDVVITTAATSSITLSNFYVTNLHPEDVRFVA